MAGDSSELPAAPAQTTVIPIWDTVKAGCNTVFGDFQTFFNAAWVWTLIVSGAALAGALLTMWTFLPLFALVISGGAALVCMSAFLVSWHRHVLLGEPAPEPGQLRIGPREWRFLLFSLAPVGIMVGAGIVIAIFGFIGLPGFLVMLLSFAAAAGVIYVGVRICLYAPLASLDEPGNLLQRSWNLTRGNGLQLFCGLFVIGLAFGIAGAIIRALMDGMMHNVGVILAVPLMIVMFAVYFAQAACMAGFLCHASAIILGWKLPLRGPTAAV
jgi:hypothetical protein